MTIESNIPVNGTDKLLDTTEVTQANGDVTDREVIVLADPMDNAARLKVEKDPNTDDYKIEVRDKQLQQVCLLLDKIHEQQKLTNAFLEGILQ